MPEPTPFYMTRSFLVSAVFLLLLALGGVAMALTGGEAHTSRADVPVRRTLAIDDGGDFLRALTEHMLTYALGRKLEYYDAPAVAEIVAHVEKNDYRFSALVAGIVRSYPFRYIKLAETEK